MSAQTELKDHAEGVPKYVFFDGRLPPEVSRRVEAVRTWPGVQALAVMPDAHPAGTACVGLVVATSHLIYPSLVGEDIGCGMASVALVTAPALEPEAVLDRLRRAVPIHRHPSRGALPALGELSAQRLEHAAARDGAAQFATLGGGNHFLELQVDGDGTHWLTVHSGSRAMGAAVRARAGDSPLVAESAEGQAYLRDVAWCRRYALASRLAILEAAARALEAQTDPESLVECDHNHLALEEGRWIHRKGVTPAHRGKQAVIAGSMGTRTFHVEGRGCPEALHSASHGAGRCLTRTEARAQVSVKDLRRQMGAVMYDRRLERGLVEEAPSAYRDIRRVLRAQKALVKLVRELRPLVVHKG